jgi:hypothetical protein
MHEYVFASLCFLASGRCKNARSAKKPKTKYQNAARLQAFPLSRTRPASRAMATFHPLHLHLLLDTLRPSAFPPDLLHGLRLSHPEARARLDSRARTLRVPLSPAELDLETTAAAAAERPPAPFPRTDLTCLQLEIVARLSFGLRAAAPLEAWLRWFQLPPAAAASGLVTLRVRDPEAQPSLLLGPNQDDDDDDFYESDEDARNPERDEAPPGRPGFPYLPLVTAFGRACSLPQRAALRHLHLDHARLTPALLRAVRATWPGLTALCLTRPRQSCSEGDREALVQALLEGAAPQSPRPQPQPQQPNLRLWFDNRFCGEAASHLVRLTHLTALVLRLDDALAGYDNVDREGNPLGRFDGDLLAGVLAIACELPHLRVLHLQGSSDLADMVLAPDTEQSPEWARAFPAPLHTLTLTFGNAFGECPAVLLRRLLPAAAPHLRHLGLYGIPPSSSPQLLLPPLPELVSFDLSYDVCMEEEVEVEAAWGILNRADAAAALPAQLRHLRLGEACALGLPALARLTALETLVFERTVVPLHLFSFLNALSQQPPQTFLPSLRTLCFSYATPQLIPYLAGSASDLAAWLTELLRRRGGAGLLTLAVTDVPRAWRQQQPQQQQQPSTAAWQQWAAHADPIAALFPKATAKYPPLE